MSKTRFIGCPRRTADRGLCQRIGGATVIGCLTALLSIPTDTHAQGPLVIDWGYCIHPVSIDCCLLYFSYFIAPQPVACGELLCPPLLAGEMTHTVAPGTGSDGNGRLRLDQRVNDKKCYYWAPACDATEDGCVCGTMNPPLVGKCDDVVTGTHAACPKSNG